VIAGIGEGARIWRDQHQDTVSGPGRRLGWHETSLTKGTCISALQRAVLEDSLTIHSGEAVSWLRQLTLDEQGRLLDQAGVHDEDAVLLGVAAHLIERVAPPAKCVLPPPPKNMREAILRMGQPQGPRVKGVRHLDAW
jgi:hypothetical protein